MPKFCGKCGSKLDEITGLCPNCDNKPSSSGDTKALNNDTIDEELIKENDKEEALEEEISERTGALEEKEISEAEAFAEAEKPDEAENSEEDQNSEKADDETDNLMSEQENAANYSDVQVTYKPKFCKKCGAKLDDNGLCSNCDSAQSNNSQTVDDEFFAPQNDISALNNNSEYKDDFSDDGTSKNENKSGKKKIIAVIVTVLVIVIAVVAFALLDLFGVIGTGIFESMGINPFGTEEVTQDSTQASSVETTVSETTTESTTEENTVPETTKKSSESKSSSSKSKSSSSSSKASGSSAPSKSSQSGGSNSENGNTVSWKQAYIDRITEEGNGSNSDHVRNYSEYCLAYINNDDIPELIIDYKMGAMGSEVCTFSGNTLTSIQYGQSGVAYLERQNLIWIPGGHMDVYFDYIYSIENGDFTLVAEGHYGAPNNESVTYDSNGYPNYEYNWNGVEMDQSDYESSLYAAFDMDSAIETYGSFDNYSYYEILDLLNSYN